MLTTSVKIITVAIFFNFLTSCTSSFQEKNVFGKDDTSYFQHEVKEIVSALNKVLDFMDIFYYELNLDAALGLTLAQAQLLQVLDDTKDMWLRNHIKTILFKAGIVHAKIRKNLILPTPKEQLYAAVLLEPSFWEKPVKFSKNSLPNLGIYNWTEGEILADKKAVYKGVPTDVCLFELLKQHREAPHSCEINISPFCQEMMLANRIDKGYLLTHRLLFLQILLRNKCINNKMVFKNYLRKYCALILKEAKTNDRLGFPQQDIFLEQMTLCGMEGYGEFLNDHWREKIMNWQTPQGCYKSEKKLWTRIILRSSNTISFGCKDHTTGLGASSLALNLRLMMSQL